MGEERGTWGAGGEQVEKGGGGGHHLFQQLALQLVNVDKCDGVAALEDLHPRKA